jgi:hypothetical protein
VDGVGPGVLDGWPGAASPTWASGGGRARRSAAGGGLVAVLLAALPGTLAATVGGGLLRVPGVGAPGEWPVCRLVAAAGGLATRV